MPTNKDLEQHREWLQQHYDQIVENKKNKPKTKKQQQWEDLKKILDEINRHE